MSVGVFECGGSSAPVSVSMQSSIDSARTVSGSIVSIASGLPNV